MNRTLGGVASGSIPVGNGASIELDNARAATLLWVLGVEGGVEVYTAGRFYLSAAVGWARPTWVAPDMEAMQANPQGGFQMKQLPSDTFTFKLGIGI